MKNITVIGTGYVGLVSGAGLSNFGNRVICADIDKIKIKQLALQISIQVWAELFFSVCI